MTQHPFRGRSLLVVLIAALLVGGLASPASAEDDLHALEEEVDEAAKDYSEAKDELEEAEDKQEDLEDEIEKSEKRIEALTEEIDDFAEAAYLSGGMPSANAVLAAGSPESVVDRMATVGYLGDQSATQLESFQDAAVDLEAQKDSLDDEIKAAEKAAKEQKDAKEKAEAELEEAAEGPTSGNGAADGYPGGDGGCSETDPTGTGGCVTPRMLHSYNEAQGAGYTRYTSCYRDGGSGEHPQGRACDFAAAEGGFGEHASGGDKEYGDSLAGWFVDNADALGVYYVIWYNQIWMASSGWTNYSGGNTGDPSADHTDHVHVSVN